MNHPIKRIEGHELIGIDRRFFRHPAVIAVGERCENVGLVSKEEALEILLALFVRIAEAGFALRPDWVRRSNYPPAETELIADFAMDVGLLDREAYETRNILTFETETLQPDHVA